MIKPRKDTGGVRHLFTAAQAEQILGIPAATVRSWANRKRIYHYGLDSRDKPMYDREDLVRLRELSVSRRRLPKLDEGNSQRVA